MRLGVNIDHVATVRQARLAPEPEPVAAAVLAELAGAHGITVHLRGDRRHIQERDLELLRQVVATKLNLEMAATPEMIDIAARVKPHQVTLVPEQPEELTTTGGLDVVRHRAALRIVVESVRRDGIRTSLFVDADIVAGPGGGGRSRGCHRDQHRSLTPTPPKTRARSSSNGVAGAVAAAAERGLEVLAGHGLTYQNVGPIAAIAAIEELNIGHSIVARAVLVGMERAVREMLALLQAGRR